jgi:hypothetical protein
MPFSLQTNYITEGSDENSGRVVVYFVLLLLRHLFGGYRHLMTLHDSVAHSSVAIAFANRMYGAIFAATSDCDQESLFH